MPEYDWDEGQWWKNFNAAGIQSTAPTGMLAWGATAAPAAAPAPVAAAPAPAPAGAKPYDTSPYQPLGAVSALPMTEPQANPNLSAEDAAMATNWFGGAASAQRAATSGQAGAATGSTRPEVYTGTGYNGGAAAGGTGGASAAGGTPASGPYRTPDWLRNSVLMLDQSPEAQRAFFAEHPEYEEDWRRIQAGGNSAFATDGSTLIRSNFDNMSPEAAAYYRENKDALLANEGFGHDPTLAYMNYYGGAAAIGANNKTQNISSYLQQHRWTPDGVVGGANNPLMYANTAYGAGTAGYLNGRPGQPTPGTPGAPGGTGGSGGAGGVGGGGTYGSGSSGGASSTGGPSVTRAVDSGTETIEGRVQNLLRTDASGNYTNPLIQQAVEGALKQFSGRGLLNSSMASQAAYQAAMSKAIEIAGPDAQTYFSQGRANQDAANVFERDSRGYAEERIKLDKQLAQDATQFEKDLAYRYTALNVQAESQAEASRLAREHELIMQENSAVNSSYDLYLRRISDIDANPNLDAATKAQMKNAAGRDFDLYAKAKKIAWDMNLGDRYSTTGGMPQTAADAANETTGGVRT